MWARDGRNRGAGGRLAGFLLMLTVSVAVGGAALAQSEEESEESIPAEEAAEHVGEEATVCGSIVETAYIAEMEGEPTFLNFGASYPDQLFSIVIFSEDSPKFRRRPDRYFRDQEVCVTGTIELADSGVRIVVTDPAAIEIIEPEA